MENPCWKTLRKKLKLQKQRALSQITFQNTQIAFVWEKSARTRASAGVSTCMLEWREIQREYFMNFQVISCTTFLFQSLTDNSQIAL